MILIIAEKPSLGRDIADALDGTVTERNARFIRKGNYIVTWVFGHMLTLKEPEDYDEKYKKWSLGELPIFFENWGLKIGQDSGGRNYETKEQRVNLIGELLKESEFVIHAGDPDEEGQLLIDELLRWFDYSKPVMRLNTGDTTRGGLIKALSNMKDNSESVNEGWSAYARSVADMTMGVNMSRFFTCLNSGALLSVGRVQTPTLGLVVNRDLQIEGHVKSTYYDIYADIDVETDDGNKTVTAKYTPKSQKKDAPNKHITEIGEAASVLNSVKDRRFDNIIIEHKTVEEDPPLPFNLVKLQSYCSSHFGYNPAEVMDITQSLRETHKAITYNRSDCQYLSEEHFKEAPKTLAQVIQNINYKPKELDTNIHSKCFNDDNIMAHFAIIPTDNKVDLQKLTESERNVYLAVCKYYMAQFLPKAVKEKTKLTADVDEEYMFASYSTETVKKGYLAIFKEAKTEEATVLGEIADGTYSGNVTDARYEEKETKPPSRYTKATLNEDMTRIAKYVTDQEVKKILLEKDKDKKGENGSIGTAATRSGIIDSLIKKGYISEKGKKLISTELGRELYRILPDEIKMADMTAKWWAIQEDIRSGEKDYTALTENVLDTVNKILSGTYPLVNQTVMSKSFSQRYQKVIGECPLCGGNIVEGQKAFGCSNWKEPMCCKFTIWKKTDRGIFAKTNISATTVKKLLSGKSVHMKKLVKNNGDIFEADIVLKVDKDAKYPVQLTFAK